MSLASCLSIYRDRQEMLKPKYRYLEHLLLHGASTTSVYSCDEDNMSQTRLNDRWSHQSIKCHATHREHFLSDTMLSQSELREPHVVHFAMQRQGNALVETTWSYVTRSHGACQWFKSLHLHSWCLWLPSTRHISAYSGGRHMSKRRIRLSTPKH